MAPIVAALVKWGLPLLAGAAATKGEEFLKEKLGVDIGSMLNSEDGRIKLKELEMRHQEFLVNAAQASEARQLDYFKEEVKDRSSARESNAAIATSEAAPWYQKALMPMLSFLVTFGFFACLGALFYLSAKGIKLDDNTRDVLIYAFGVLSAGFMSIMNYVFGSSSGSTAKDRYLGAILKEKV
jgi:hypothetical protein